MKRKLTLIVMVFVFLICTSHVQAENKYQKIENVFKDELVFEVNASGVFELKDGKGTRNQTEEVFVSAERVSTNYITITFRVHGDDIIQGIQMTTLEVKHPTSGTVYHSEYFSASGGMSYNYSATTDYIYVPAGVTSVKVKTTGLRLYYYNTGYLGIYNINDTITISN